MKTENTPESTDVVEAPRTKERIVQLRRKNQSIPNLPNELVDAATIRLGSRYNGMGPLRGFTGENEKKYVSRYLGISPNDPLFAAKATEFWHSLYAEVPSGGLLLNISLDEENEPVNLKDWIIYHWANVHGRVAKTREEMEGDSYKDFYIFDPDIYTKTQNNFIKIKKEAYKEFILLGKDENKMDKVLRMLTGTSNRTLSKEEKENSLYNYVDKNPDKFLTLVHDKDLDDLIFIEDALEFRVISKVGTSFLYGNDLLANTTNELLMYLKDPSNGTTVAIMQAKIETAKDSLRS